MLQYSVVASMSNSHSDPAPTASDVEARRLYLESKVDALRLKLTATLSELNDLVAATSRLPPELLSEVFSHCMKETEGQTGIGTQSHLLAITHVCRRWRRVAIAYERLWTAVDVSCHPEFLEAALQRSGESLLDLAVTFGELSPRIQANTASVLRQSPKIYSITIRDPTATDIFLRHLPSSLELPQLQVLSLNMLYTKGQRIYTVPPLLRSSSLTTCRFASMPIELWTKLAMCTSLEMLHITRISASSTGLFNLVMIKTVLNSLPRLRELGFPLHSFLWQQADDQSWSAEDVHMEVALPYLRRLTIVGNVVFCASVIRLLSFPKTTFIHMEIEGIGPLSVLPREPSELARHATALAAATSSLVSRDAEQFVELNFDAPQHRSVLQVEAWKPSKTQEGYIVPVLMFQFPVEPGYLSAVRQSFVSEGVKTVLFHDRLREKPPGILKEMADIVNAFSNLHDLVLDESSDGLINALSPQAGLFLPRIGVLHVRTSDLRPCIFSAHDKCKNCLGLLQSALKTELSRQNALVRSLKIYSTREITLSNLKVFLDVADEVYYECMDDDSISHSSNRTGNTDASELGTKQQYSRSACTHSSYLTSAVPSGSY